tara:strand:- start:246 stop:863 length:618 start_codon:yes stop_codon:yes gene_type:complete
MEYRNESQAEHHRVLHEVSIDRQALLDFYNMFPKETHLPWNEFKRKYNPNNKYTAMLTDDFKMVYAPAYEGKELIEYPIIQNLISKFNFKNPLIVTDVQILTYDAGFRFKKHVDREVNWSMFFPILPEWGGEPLVYHKGSHRKKDDGPEIYRVYYSTKHMTLTDGKVMHRVPKMSEQRVLLRIRSGDETYDELLDKINKGTFFNL